jgi:hypothetical protein
VRFSGKDFFRKEQLGNGAGCGNAAEEGEKFSKDENL